MNPAAYVRRARRILRKPPSYIAQRLAHEAIVRVERARAPWRDRRLDERRLLALLDAPDIDTLCDRLAARPYVARLDLSAERFDELCPGARAHLREAAARARARDVDLLGTGPFTLTDWHTDVKTGSRWAPAWFRSIDYAQLGRPTDVKTPWEVSRLQWAIPLAQLYVLERDERDATFARELIDDWIGENPYAASVNWTSPMEAALRIVTWTFLFHAFASSDAWRDSRFRVRFLRMLYLHADFVARNLERSDVNGNHFDADAAGLVFAGCFFGDAGEPWQRAGWSILRDELPRQVSADGVDYEGSTSYHRLVAELFLLPALYREQVGLEVGDAYRAQVAAMAEFAASYTRADGSSPLLGDADDARVLPLGDQPLLDHRYLADVVHAAWGLGDPSGSAPAETVWLTGVAPGVPRPRLSRRFDGGYACLRHGADHVFIDCAPVGLGGRGGHGHNDCLGIEVVLAGVPLIVDSGSYVYTASVEERNAFRRTEAHCTPRIDDQELNRMPEPTELWTLTYDALPFEERWEDAAERVLFSGGHRGYERLTPPAIVVRTVAISKARAAVAVFDEVRSEGARRVAVPFHLAPGVHPTEVVPGTWALAAGDRRFTLAFRGAGYKAHVLQTWVAPSYGVKQPRACIEIAAAPAREPLLVAIEAGDVGAEAALHRAEELVR